MKAIVPFALFLLLSGFSPAVADENESFMEVVHQIQQGDLDAARESLAKATEEFPDSRRLGSLHSALSTLLSREGRHAEAAEHAAANVDLHWSEFEQGRTSRQQFILALTEMTDAYILAGKSEAAQAKLDVLLASAAKAVEANPDSRLAALVLPLEIRKAALLAEAGNRDEANDLLNELHAEAVKDLEENPADMDRVLAIAELLAARAEFAETADAQAAARKAHATFLVEQAKKHADNPEVRTLVITYTNSQIASIRELMYEDAKAADEQFKSLEEFLNAFESEQEAVQRVVDRSRSSLSSIKRRLDSMLAQQALIGKPAFPIADAVDAWANGQPLTDEDLRGKVVLVDFWAVWCGPCIATFPHLREWQEKYADQGLVIIGATKYYQYDWDDETERIKKTEELTPEDERAAMERFAEHHELKHPFLVQTEEESLAEKYSVLGIPTAVLIDRQGIVRMIRVGNRPGNAEALDEMIRQLIDGSKVVAQDDAEG